MIIQYILYFICQKLYWTVSGQLSNIGYIGQFQNEATGTLRTRYRRTKAVSMCVIKILSIFLHLWKILDMFSHRLVFIVNNIFNIGWLTVQYRLYWTQISYIGLGCASSNIAFFVQYNLYWTVNHPIVYNIIHCIPIGQWQTRICPTWSSNIAYISFAKSCILDS